MGVVNDSLESPGRSFNSGTKRNAAHNIYRATSSTPEHKPGMCAARVVTGVHANTCEGQRGLEQTDSHEHVRSHTHTQTCTHRNL